MNKADVFARILAGKPRLPHAHPAEAFAPSNIALCKYWGKRDEELNLPLTSSLSISLGDHGTRTRVAAGGAADEIRLNGTLVLPEDSFARGITRFLDFVRPAKDFGFRVDTHNTIPTAAGLASSASGFAALVLALDQLFGWKLSRRDLSILARLGSGSASRSVHSGFVEWHAGQASDGMDSFAERLAQEWPELRIGLVTVSESAKPIGSREAMKRTKATSALYASWSAKVEHDLALIREAIGDRNFGQLGQAAESNALSMHATMVGAWPPVLYWLPESVSTMQRIWKLRADGLGIYFTMDAGPNVKLIFLDRDAAAIGAEFPGVDIIAPFEKS